MLGAVAGAAAGISRRVMAGFESIMPAGRSLKAGLLGFFAPCEEQAPASNARLIAIRFRTRVWEAIERAPTGSNARVMTLRFRMRWLVVMFSSGWDWWIWKRATDWGEGRKSRMFTTAFFSQPSPKSETVATVCHLESLI